MQNKKNKKNLLLPLVVIVVLISVVAFLLWKENILDLFKPYPYAMTRIDNYPAVVETTKKIDSRKKAVVSSKEEFDALMNEILSDTSKVNLPSVDFNKERLLISTTQSNDSFGYGIKVKSIVKDEENKKLNAIITYTKPGETCINEEKANIAIDMVKIEKNGFEVSFESEMKTKECK